MRRATAALWALAMAVVVLQAVALVSVYFAASLDGDITYPERFVRDALSGEFPLSGWTLSSAPYFFPDFAGLAALCVLGLHAPVVAIYPLIFYPALALACGAVLRRVNGAGWDAWLAGALVVNALLICRGWTDHARALWWLGGAGFHGGAVLLGLFSFALWCGPANEPLSRARWIFAAVLMTAGVASDTLLFTQFLAPLAAVFAFRSGENSWRAPRVRQLLGALAVALVVVVTLRIGLRLAGGWTASGVFRYAPSPDVVARSGQAFLADMLSSVARDQGWLLALAGAGLIAGVVAWRRDCRVERRQFDWLVLASLTCTIALPIFSGYWKNPQHARYLLPLFVLPALWAATVGLSGPWWGRGVSRALMAALLVGMAAFAWCDARADFAMLPYPAKVAQLDAWAKQRGFARGLGDYWTSHYLNATNRSGLWLNQLRPDGSVQFWNNNAFHHYRGVGAASAVPEYAFIVTAGLNEKSLEARFGAPQQVEQVGDFRVWIYDGEARTRLNRQIATAIREKLADRWGAAPILAREK
jgi:hypothetical protein